MRADGSSLPLDRVAGAGDRRRESDAVLSIADVVVHRLRNANDLDAEIIKLGRIAERVIPADGNQMFDTERRKVRQHLLGDVPGLGGATQGDWKVLAGEMSGQFLDFGGVGAARVQHGSPAPVDRARVLTVQLHDIMRPAGRVIEVQMRECLPTSTESEDLNAILAAAVGGALMTELRPGTSPPPVSMP